MKNEEIWLVLYSDYTLMENNGFIGGFNKWHHFNHNFMMSKMVYARKFLLTLTVIVL